MKKHVREILHALREEFPGIEIEPLRKKTHQIFNITYRGKCRRLAVSTSPSNADYTVRNAVTEARKLLTESTHAH